jgi:hypothetical protein
MLAIKGIFDGNSVHLIDVPKMKNPCNVIVTFLEDYDPEEESLREYYAQTDGMDFWKCEEEDLYQDYLINKTLKE